MVYLFVRTCMYMHKFAGTDHAYIHIIYNRCLQVYASGKDVVIVDGHLIHIQTVQGDVPIRALHCSEGSGKIAVAWDTDVVIFNPEPHEGSSEETASGDLSAPVASVVSRHVL